MHEILLITHYFPAHGGGVENVAATLAARLSRTLDWNIVWLASDTDPVPGDVPRGVECLPMAAWNGLERRLGVPWPVWAPGALRRLWKRIGRADVVHIHDALYFGSLFAWFFARLRDVPVIVTQHVGHVPYRSAFLRGLHALANRTLGRLVLSNADQVVFISPAVRREFEGFCRFRIAPHYLPNGVDLNLFTPKGGLASDAPIAAARGAGRHVFLFVGRFVEKKGLPILRELARKFRDDLWLFAGQGPMDPEVWGLSNVMVIRGASGAELARYYRAVDLLVLPSVGEGFPLVVQEAMACGTPALIGEETADGCPAARPVLFVEKIGGDSAARWAEAIERLVADPSCLSRRRHEVAEFAIDNWSWEATAAEYARMISAIAPSGQKSTPTSSSP